MGIGGVLESLLVLTGCNTKCVYGVDEGAGGFRYQTGSLMVKSTS